MFKGYLFLVLTGFEIVCSLRPPRIPKVYLPGQKFSLPPICSNAAEWGDLAVSLQILTDMTEPKHDKSAFTALMNLIKFILIKEEVSCNNNPVVVTKPRPEGRISSAVATLQNSQIVSRIEAALARKPVQTVTAVVVNDHIDVPNVIPVIRTRSKTARSQAKVLVTGNNAKSNSTCSPAVLQNVGGFTLIGANANPVVTSTASNMPCQCSKCAPTLTIKPVIAAPTCGLQCQKLASPKISPVFIGCGQNCNICQKLSSPVLLDCQKLINSPVLTTCQKPTTIVLTGDGSQVNTALSLLQSKAIPLMDCYSNMLKRITTTILVPYCISKFLP